MKPQLIIYWCRRDFRLHDNPALYQAIEKSKKEQIAFLPLFILENYMVEGSPRSQFGYPSRLFLSKALPAFAQNFSNFTLIQGKAAQIIVQLSQYFALEIFANEDVHPDFYTQIKKLHASGIHIHLMRDQLSVDTMTQSKNGTLYSVFTPFKNNVWQSFLSQQEAPYARPADAYIDTVILPSTLDIVECTPHVLTQRFHTSRTILIHDEIIDLNDYTPIPNLNPWYHTETEALLAFDLFLQQGMHHYATARNDLDGDIKGQKTTSHMSLALTWGLVSARTIKNRILEHYKITQLDIQALDEYLGAKTYITELLWREFYKYLLFHQPNLLYTEFQAKFRKLNWGNRAQETRRFIAWLSGKTGYPIVDAAMYQLMNTGWMHNRARMIVASILTKNLGVDWRWGQEYFRAALIDLDEASNNGGWQWSASVGADPKPIRVFNPYIQADKFDPSEAYRKAWLPQQYTAIPLVEHRTAREEAIARYKSL